MTAAWAGLSRTLAAELPSAVPGSSVLIEGWVHRRRALGGVTFLILRDRSGRLWVACQQGGGLNLLEKLPPMTEHLIRKTRAGSRSVADS